MRFLKLWSGTTYLLKNRFLGPAPYLLYQFLLLCNTWPLTQQCKTTHIQYILVLKSQVWAMWLGVLGLRSNQGQLLTEDSGGKIRFKSDLGCWQNSVSCWLSAEGSFLLLEANYIFFHTALPIFKPAKAHGVLSALGISLTSLAVTRQRKLSASEALIGLAQAQLDNLHILRCASLRL